MSGDSVVSSWPPVLSERQLAALTLQATTYALSHGLGYLPPAPSQPPAPTSAIHAPLALFPSPIPRVLFAHAKLLQRIYNVLYARVATDVEFLDRVMGETGVGKVDEFTGELWKRWKRARESRADQVRVSPVKAIEGVLTCYEAATAWIVQIRLHGPPPRASSCGITEAG